KKGTHERRVRSLPVPISRAPPPPFSTPSLYMRYSTIAFAPAGSTDQKLRQLIPAEAEEEAMGIRRNKGRWTSEEHEAFLLGLRLFKRDNWAAVAAVVPTRTVLQVRTHAQKYFNKVDRGEDFPEEPYPSQYDAEAGKSGVAAGAYLYGVSHQTQRQLQHREHGVVDTPTSMDPSTALLPQQPGNGTGSDAGGFDIEPHRRYSGGLLNDTGPPQRSASATATSLAAVGLNAPPSADAGVVVPPSTTPSTAYGGRGSSHPVSVPLLEGDTSREARHRHAYPAASSAGASLNAVRCRSIGASAPRSAVWFADGGGFAQNNVLDSQYYEGGVQRSGEGVVGWNHGFPRRGHGGVQV
ncbi:unnamed protein product, partial [Scytosiphon promiscuus]